MEEQVNIPALHSIFDGVTFLWRRSVFLVMHVAGQRGDSLVNPGIIKLQDWQKIRPSGGLNFFKVETKKNL